MMFKAAGTEIMRRSLIVRCMSSLLAIAVCLVSVPVSFADTAVGFTSDAKQAFTASVTISGSGDSDFDGMDDSWESSFGLPIDSSNHDDLFEDGDGDGLTNLEEYRMGTDPTQPNNNIIAALAASPSSGTLPIDITFTITANANSGPAIAKYEWDFDGNGTYDQWCYESEGNTATYKYTAAGTYNVKARITNANGEVKIATLSSGLVINGNGSSDPSSTLEGGLLQHPATNLFDIRTEQILEGSGSVAGSDYIVRYQWDTNGNGEYDVSSPSSANFTKVYSETISKSFVGSLKVTDTRGYSDIAHMSVMTDSTSWNDSPYRPKVYLDVKVVESIGAGNSVNLSGYGTPQGNVEHRFPAGEYGYTKKLEWDFESDGVIDWSTSLLNRDTNTWTRQVDTANQSYIYGAPGIYRATLRINTEATLSATDSVLVIVSENGTPPQAEARTTYNGLTSSVREINGIAPIEATFECNSSSAIEKYEWDFDGDKSIDYTSTSYDTPIYIYKYPGYYVAMLRVTDASGLIDTSYIPVFVQYPVGYNTSYIKIPARDNVIAGNAVTLSAEVFPDDVSASDVTFQYTVAGAASWNTISDGPVTSTLSYSTIWNTEAVADGDYEIRAIVNGGNLVNFEPIAVTVDNSNPSAADINESTDGSGDHTKTQIVDPDEATIVSLPDGARIEIPAGAVPAGSNPAITITQATGAGINEVVLEVTGIEYFLKPVTIIWYYPDENDDGIVDGTSVSEMELRLAWQAPDGTIDILSNAQVHPDENYLSGETDHFSGIIPIVIGGGAAAAGGTSGASSSDDGGAASYCFIATAAYGTPMTDDVLILRKFRDKYLIRNSLGREFVWNYYRYSPPAAKFISKRPILKKITRMLLKPLVKLSKRMVR